MKLLMAMMLLAGVISPVCRATDYTSPATVNATFKCPEGLADDAARTVELRGFLDWTHRQHPDWSMPKITGYRLYLLERLHCERTVTAISTTKVIH
jgi:hypothetical protein